MKFELSTSKYFYPDENERIELSKLGFTFRPSEYKYAFRPSEYKEYIIEGTPEIEINSLEELIEFSKEFGELIIEDKSIEIYNGYRE